MSSPCRVSNWKMCSTPAQAARQARRTARPSSRWRRAADPGGRQALGPVCQQVHPAPAQAAAAAPRIQPWHAACALPCLGRAQQTVLPLPMLQAERPPAAPATRILKKTAWELDPNCMMSRSSALWDVLLGHGAEEVHAALVDAQDQLGRQQADGVLYPLDREEGRVACSRQRPVSCSLAGDPEGGEHAACWRPRPARQQADGTLLARDIGKSRSAGMRQRPKSAARRCSQEGLANRYRRAAVQQGHQHRNTRHSTCSQQASRQSWHLWGCLPRRCHTQLPHLRDPHASMPDASHLLRLQAHGLTRKTLLGAAGGPHRRAGSAGCAGTARARPPWRTAPAHGTLPPRPRASPPWAGT